MPVKIAYVTTGRSDYGPAAWLIKQLFSDVRFDVSLIVGGAHLAPDFGLTVQEIEEDSWSIAARVAFLQPETGAVGFARGAAAALAEYAKVFERLRPDLVMLYGDRFELLPIATAAVLLGIPIAHLCGGDITEGAVDDQIRHALTKLAHVHFPSSERSARRVLQMGEEPWRVHMVGDPALDNFVHGPRATDEEVRQAIGFAPDRSTLLVTFHPATLEHERIPQQVEELMIALKEHTGPIIMTAPAPDPGRDVIHAACLELARENPRAVLVPSLGNRCYRSVLYSVGAMVGNSSSGLIEAPCVPLPVVNIGGRQRGRDRASNVIDVPAKRRSVRAGIARALSPEFRASLGGLRNPYGDGHATERILRVLGDLSGREQLLTKHFVGCEGMGA